MNKSSGKIYIIDGNAYIHRAYHALPKNLTTTSGLPVNAVFGFIRMIFKILKTYKPEYLCICLDSDKPTFRHKIFKEYKATRKELEEDIKVQFPLVYEFVKNSGFPYIVIDGYEADDLISFIVRKFKKDYDIVIISGDKDILQLVDGKNVVVYNEHKNIFYDENEVIKKYQVPPELLVDYFSLIGDKTDNIVGVDGIGPKTASLLINKYGDLEKIFINIDKLEPKLKQKLTEKREQLYRNKELLKLTSSIEELENIQVENFKISNIKIDRIKEFILKYEMRSLLEELKKIKLFIENSNYSLFQFSKQNESSLKEKKAICVNDEKKFTGLIKDIENSKIINFSFIYTKKNIIGLILKVDLFYYYIPFIKQKNLKGETIDPLSEKCFFQIVDFLFFETNKLKISFNIKAQLKLLNVSLKKLDNNIFDILLLSYLLNPDRKYKTLQEIVDYFLTSKPVAEFMLPDNIDVFSFPQDTFADRFIDSLDVLNLLFERLKEKLTEYDLYKVYENIDLPLNIPLIKMEKNGILLDKVYTEKFKSEIEEKIKETKSRIYELAGLEFNINSPKQLAFVLFEKLRLPPIKRKKTGYSTDEEVLRKLSNVHPIISSILQYRELEKLKNTYINPFIQHINPSTQRIHTVFNITGTATGRLSSEEPNMQNLPIKTELGRKIRQMFVAQENFMFVSLDYSQIELRILAHFSKDKNLITAFFENKDIHKSTACEIFGFEEKNIDENLRRIAKVINFGIIYGITPQGLGNELNIPSQIAEDYIKKYFEKYVQVKQWITDTINSVKHYGYVKTLFGRIRFIPEINSPNRQLAAFGERLAINTPIQGTAADIIKLAMIKIDDVIQERKLEDKVKMLLQIHDELLFEIHERYLDEVVPIIKNIMENIVKLEVPLVVDVTISKRWGQDN
ncbi:MAG: DNA polymerase I [Endomicrobiia bacterium]